MSQLTNHYKVPEDKVALLEAEPAKYLPELAAQLHANILEAAVNGIASMLPNFLMEQQAAEKRYAAAEQQFFSKWPELNKPEYGETILNFTRTFKQLNPKATPQQVIDQVGVMAMTHLNLGVPATVLPPATPATPPMSTAPTTPIVPGGGGRVPQAQTKNPWEELAEEDLD